MLKHARIIECEAELISHIDWCVGVYSEEMIGEKSYLLEPHRLHFSALLLQIP